MSLLVESIKVWNGRLCHMKYHEARVNKARKGICNVDIPIHLKEKIFVPSEFKKGLVKCRVLYDTDINEVSFSTYKIREIKTLKLVFATGISYEHKFLERRPLDILWGERGIHDEIIIINDGCVTDAYYYNLVFENKHGFFTPQHPLLHGVRRQILLDKNTLFTKEIKVEDIKNYDRVHLINALTPLGKVMVDIGQIY